MQMGMPPDMPLVVDMSLAQPFYDVFDAVDNWQRKSDRSLDELPGIIAKIPELEDIDVEGRSVLGPVPQLSEHAQGVRRRERRRPGRHCCNPPSGSPWNIAWT